MPRLSETKHGPSLAVEVTGGECDRPAEDHIHDTPTVGITHGGEQVTIDLRYHSPWLLGCITRDLRLEGGSIIVRPLGDRHGPFVEVHRISRCDQRIVRSETWTADAGE